MPLCEICGTEESSLATVNIDGAELESCSNCSTMGVVIEEAETEDEDDEDSLDSEPQVAQTQSYQNQYQMNSEPEPANNHKSFEDDVEELVFDYDERIRKSREQMGKSRKEVASNINEKTSLLERLERGKALPSEKVRRKLENELDIELTSKGGI